ncbi:MAG: aspartyl protease family protein [Candidatus Omnitrophica bacterium]|nr:aspartyl protease family protein [Candidatus Omnitrophota bacterium]
MRFPYQQHSRNASEAFPQKTTRLLPIIPVTFHGKEQITIDMLVDSGASACLVPGFLGIALGIDVHSGPRQKITGLGGRQVEARYHNVDMYPRP